MKVKLHTLAWNQDKAAEESDDASALVHGVLELDGQLIRNGEVKISTEGGGILKVTAEILPTSLEVVIHDEDSWDSLDAP